MKPSRVVDYPLVSLALILSAFGVAMVYSAGQTDVPSALVVNLWKKQLVWLAIGLVAAWFASRASVRLLDWMATPIYIGTCLVLLLLLFVGSGSGTAASTKSWLSVGGIKLGQPAELAKIAVVLMLAKVFAARKDAPRSLLDLWWPGLVAFVPWLLIMAQPDLGTALVFIGIFFAMLFWSGASWQLLVLAASPVVSLMLAFNTNVWGAWFLLLIGLVVWYKPYIAEGVFIVLINVGMGVVAPLIWDKLSPYQRGRFVSFLDPKSDPLHSGYHVLQSQVAIGSGGWIGKGFTAGTQKRLAFLPAQQNDFIFPVVGEELGFLGVALALALFLFLFLRCVRVAARATDSFASLIAFGLVATWFVHLLVNVGMSLNLMPITGIPLPFFSYGGSFMLACWVAVGMEVRLSAEGRGKADMLVI